MSTFDSTKPADSSESEDDDYVPSAEESEGDESDAENDARSDAEVPAGKKPKRTKKKTFVEVLTLVYIPLPTVRMPTLRRLGAGKLMKCKGGIYLEGEASPAHRSPDKANDAEELVPALNPDEEKKRADDLWSDFLRDVEPNPRKRIVPAASVVSRSTMKRTGKTVPPAQLQNLAMLVKRLLCNMPNRLRRVPRDQGRGV
nr:craniofacial development protein 1-like [Rhipicephalus microplus]